MKAKCTLCGKEEEIGKLHKDFKKIKANPSSTHFCDACSFKLSAQAKKNSDTFDTN